ncbi:uncharacterized protein LOC115544561 isoform X1 [Gadus morhua]|uniref:Uncharacterized LOC115544561 n=1 Tax=Gadus morhua TaxID=8049 RepID=A0A8C4ZE47_GADMO|nr:uncharacterized protein LOC115544561 isoform X1 [Gadus morhua]
MAKFQALDPFDFTKPAAWPAWRQRFSRFRIASKLNLEDDNVQVNVLLCAMGKDAVPIFNTFTFGDYEDDYYNKVINKFDVHFVPKRNTIYERACFHRRSQLQGESVEAFVRRLYELAEYCDFGIAKDEHIRDRIVVGILDSELSQKLQLESDLTLEKAISMTRQSTPPSTPNKKKLVDSRNMGLLTAAVVGTLGAGGAVVAAPFVLGAAGFTAAGITAGSWAAGMMSAAAVANGGAVAAGSTVAVLQSLGAAGLGTAATAAVASVGGAAALALKGAINGIKSLVQTNNVD